MATDEVVTLPVGGEHGTRSVELPEGWIERAHVQAERLGRSDTTETAAQQPPLPQQPEESGEIAWRYVDGRRVHPSWPPGHIEWLHEMQRTGELDLGDPDELRRAYENPRPE